MLDIYMEPTLSMIKSILGISWLKLSLRSYDTFLINSSFSSNKAIYDYKQNTVEFSGINNYKYKDESLKQFVSVQADSAIWYGDKKKLLFFTPQGKVITNLKVFK